LEDGTGARVLIPVRARGLEPDTVETEPGAGEALATIFEQNPRAGLWVGQVSVNAVSQPAVSDDPVATGSPFDFRILVHVDETGAARLLQHVLVMVKPEVTDGTGAVVEPRRIALVTDDAQIAAYEGVSKVDTSRVARRISTVAYGGLTPASPDEPKNTLLMSGMGFDSADVATSPTGVLTAEISLPYNHELNPFYHRYHPDHDNLNYQFEPLVDDPGTPEDEREGVESYDVTRRIELEFSPDNPQPNIGNPAEWRDSRVGGIYREEIEGIYRKPIHLQGIFTLTRVSAVPTLN
jgi:hypothetical protein